MDTKRFIDLTVGDFFCLPNDSHVYIRVDDYMKAVDLTTGLLWDFRAEYEVVPLPKLIISKDPILVV